MSKKDSLERYKLAGFAVLLLATLVFILFALNFSDLLKTASFTGRKVDTKPGTYQITLGATSTVVGKGLTYPNPFGLTIRSIPSGVHCTMTFEYDQSKVRDDEDPPYQPARISEPEGCEADFDRTKPVTLEVVGVSPIEPASESSSWTCVGSSGDLPVLGSWTTTIAANQVSNGSQINCIWAFKPAADSAQTTSTTAE